MGAPAARQLTLTMVLVRFTPPPPFLSLTLATVLPPLISSDMSSQ